MSLFFENDGRPASVAAPAPLELDERIIDTLLGAGIPLDQCEVTASAIEEIVRDLVIEFAADRVRVLLCGLEETPRGAAVCRVVLGDRGESLRDCARRIGCSHQALLKQIAKVREQLRGYHQGPLVG